MMEMKAEGTRTRMAAKVKGREKEEERTEATVAKEAVRAKEEAKEEGAKERKAVEKERMGKASDGVIESSFVEQRPA